jgi:hypothetical protein
MIEYTIGTPDTARELRGRIYLARLRLNRLEGAWPDHAARLPDQAHAIAQARRGLATLIREARHAGIASPRRARP